MRLSWALGLVASLAIVAVAVGCSSDEPGPRRPTTQPATPQIPEIVDGRTIAERKVVFGTVAQIQDRAACAAQRRYPGDYERQAEYTSVADVEAYETAAKIHEMEVGQVHRIVVEGARALWPMPDPPCVLR